MPYKDPEARRAAHAKYMREVWYPKNKKKHIAAVHRWRNEEREEKRAFIKEQRTACAVCGEDEPICLDFHHINPDEKEDHVALAVRRGWGKKRILAEIAKCVVLCSNCHRKLHAGLISLQSSPAVGQRPHKACDAGSNPASATS